MRRFLSTFAFLATLSACAKIDSALEGHVAPKAQLAIAITPTPTTIAQGAEGALTATVTRIGEYQGPVSVLVEGLPAGVTATVGESPAGQVTTNAITLRVAPDAQLGTYLVTLRVKASELTDATTSLQLQVVAAPAFILNVGATSVVVASAGSAPVPLTIARSNLTAPIRLVLEGPAGFSLVASENPVTGNAASLLIATSSAVAPGTYTLTLRASVTGLTDRTAVIAATVTADPFQLLAPASLTLLQGATRADALVVNRSGYAGPITATITGLPAGLSATIAPDAITANNGTLTLAADVDAPAGNYTASIRSASTTGQVVTSTFALTVQPSNVSIAATPATVSLLPGATSSVALALTRTSLTAPVALVLSGAPAGVTATLDSSLVSGTAATLTIATTASASPGVYSLTVRATPTIWPPTSGRTASIALTIRNPGTASNAVLDWSKCTPPLWVAFMDGAGPWTQVTSTDGLFRLTATSPRAAFAYAEGSRGTTAVRYVTQDEITAAPFDMCSLPAGAKSATGTVFRNGTLENVTFALGGGLGTTSTANDQVTITGIRAGVHDLIGWGTTFTANQRGMVRRDVNLPDGGSLGTISLIQTEAFTPAQAALRITVLTPQNEIFSSAMNYFTTAACTRNPLYSLASMPLSSTMFGFPDVLQRSTDFHQITVSGTSSALRRSVSLSFHTFADQQIFIPAVVLAPSVTALAGSYKRLQGVFTSMPTEYNDLFTISYTDGSVVMMVSASRAYLTSVTPSALPMPDFTSVSGWSNSYAVPSSATGVWIATLNGQSVPGSACVEGRRVVQATLTGAF